MALLKTQVVLCLASEYRKQDCKIAHVFLERDLPVLLILHWLLALFEGLFQGSELVLLLIVGQSALLQHILHSTCTLLFAQLMASFTPHATEIVEPGRFIGVVMTRSQVLTCT
jgi:hypothetical protein